LGDCLPPLQIPNTINFLDCYFSEFKNKLCNYNGLRANTLRMRESGPDVPVPAINFVKLPA
jgi:hypothetical protein